MNAELNNHHRDTLQKIFARPSSRNVEWRAVRSLLEAVGTVQERHDGKLKVTVGPETEVLSAPKHKDIDVQMLVDLRRMLAGGGFSPTG
ncbi:MAG TPA: hypothetical protein VKG38_17905, partial [Solirubrobacteraceae bacterium]|nr:hypothetical protein [Solirubrobacteraceae bacterium]